MTFRAEEMLQLFAKRGLDALPPEAFERLERYLVLLLRWNQKLNLTSDRDPEKIVGRHFIESVFVSRFLDAGTATVLDFGSGAGFPGIPIAICRPEIRVTLAESQSKKAAFLAEVVRSLELSSEVYAGRVEAMPVSRRFDAVVLRAVDKSGKALPVAAERSSSQILWMTGSRSVALAEAVTGFRWEAPIEIPGAGRSASDRPVLLTARRTARS